MTREQRIQAVATVASGLLASGHYTLKAVDRFGPDVWEKNNGERWREDGYSAWVESFVVRDAALIVEEIEGRLAWEDAQKQAEAVL